jgi:predicted kinase
MESQPRVIVVSLTIIRGLPGSGKSTLGKAMSLALGHKLLDIDDYFTDEDGNFEFVAANAGEAFRKMHHDAEDQLTAGVSVIVAASFVRHFEFNGYIRMKYDKLQVIDCHSDFASVHDVPRANLVAQKKRWESWK